jgi:rubrerythrin
MAFMRAADVTELAMELEKGGEAFYRAVAKKAPSAAVKALFEDLADQEVVHYKIFGKLFQTAQGKPFMTDQEWDMYQDYLEATVQSAFFEGADKALSVADEVEGEKEALYMAIRFEKETMLFFHDLYDAVPESEKETVSKVIAEEKRHVRRLANMLSEV